MVDEESLHPSPSPGLIACLRSGTDCHCCQCCTVHLDRSAHQHTDLRTCDVPSAPFRSRRITGGEERPALGAGLAQLSRRRPAKI